MCVCVCVCLRVCMVVSMFFFSFFNYENYVYIVYERVDVCITHKMVKYSLGRLYCSEEKQKQVKFVYLFSFHYYFIRYAYIP